jgi:RNA polymerase sigma-70 factor (ECF subfamily)
MESILTYEQVYRDYSKKVMGYIRPRINNPADAEDLHSAVFTKVYEKFSSFDQTKASISTWVYTIARNTLIDFFRTHRIYDELGDEDMVEEDAFQGILTEETLDELAEALKKLPERERDIILLHYYYNKQLKEIALKLHMSYSNCKLVHNKALMKLRQYLS